MRLAGAGLGLYGSGRQVGLIRPQRPDISSFVPEDGMPKFGDRTPGETMFKGSFTALITPMRNGAVDERAFQDLVEWQIAEGTHGLVPVGTTGESPTLSHEEHM